MRPLCLCHHSHRLPADPKELERVWSIIESWTLIRKELQQLRSPDELGRPSADILFWNRKLQVARAASIQKLKEDLSSRVKKVKYCSSDVVITWAHGVLRCYRMANRYTQQVQFKIS